MDTLADLVGVLVTVLVIRGDRRRRRLDRQWVGGDALHVAAAATPSFPLLSIALVGSGARLCQFLARKPVRLGHACLSKGVNVIISIGLHMSGKGEADEAGA